MKQGETQHKNINPNKRREDETFEQYRARLRIEQGVAKDRRQSGGRMLWNSSVDGTYERRKHGPLGGGA